MKNIVLVIERALDNELWGRVEYDDDLIVESAKTIEKLQNKMKRLLVDFHDLDTNEIAFDLQYDLKGLFDNKQFLNTNAVADVVGINKSLMRQYASGVKYPSYERAKEIEKAIHYMGQDLLSIKVAIRSKIREKDEQKKSKAAR